MSERIDHAAEAVALRALTATLGVTVGQADGLLQAAQMHATLAIVEQQRIANVINLAKAAQAQYGHYAGEAGFMGQLFDNPNTELGNMRLKPDIAAALGLTAGQEGENNE